METKNQIGINPNKKNTLIRSEERTTSNGCRHHRRNLEKTIKNTKKINKKGKKRS